MNRLYAFILPLTLRLFLPLILPAAAWAQPDWAMDPLWDDGLAEVSVYESERIVYGETRRFESVLIVVKEDFNMDLRVKADPPYAGKPLLSVLKMNLAQTIPTDNYPYHYLTSVFVERANPDRLIKETVGSQEWCGNSFKVLTPTLPEAILRYHSYFDGQGDGEQSVDFGNDSYAEDQLFVSLRQYVRGELPETIRLLPSLIHNKAGSAETVEARLKDDGQRRIETLGKEDVLCRVIALETEGFASVYMFEEEYPNRLVQYLKNDGTRMNLKTSERRAYW